MPTTAAPAVASTIGLKNMVIAPLSSDTSAGVTYGTLQAVAGAIDASVTPNNADPDVQYYDDVEGDVLYPDPEVAFKTKVADIPLAIQEMIFGNTIDNNGVLIRKAGDTPPYFAVGFSSEKADHTLRFVWLFKVRAKPVTESYSTKAGKTVTRQTGEVEWVAIKRTYDDQYQAIADVGQNGFTEAMGATFLASVYTADFSTGG
jgi:phi13 family phage major tail protein